MIRLEGIGKSYDLGVTKVSALEDVTVDIDRGEYVAVMGPSGSGKSTFLNILGILENPTSGRYLLEDYDITRLPDREQARIRNKHFGFVFQSFNLFSELSALENVMLPMGYAGVSFHDRRKRASELLERLGLQDRFHHLPTMMSGGEQQRVAIARALANEPDLILADEPTGNLPSDKGEQILQVLEDLNRQGVTIVMVTHNDAQGKRARRCIQLRDGRILGGGGMMHGEDIRMGMRWIIGRPVETLLLVFGISLGIGATAAGIALAGRTGAEARKMLQSTEYREIVVRARQSASEMDLPAILQTNTESVVLTTADLAAREDSQDVQYAYVANQTGFRFGAFDFRGGPGGGPPPGEQAGAGPGQADAAKAGVDTAEGKSTEVFIAQGPSGSGDVMVYRQSSDSGQQASGLQGGAQAGGAQPATGQQASGQQATGQQAGAQAGGAQPATGQQPGFQGFGGFGGFGRPREIVKPPEGPQPVMEEARGYEVTPDFFSAWNMSPSEGSLFSLDDVKKREPVIVLGSKLATTLFEDGQSMGRQVLSRNQLYRIIGILEPTGTEYDSMIFSPAEMPELTGMDVFARFRGFNTNLHFTVADYTKLERAKAQLESYFDQKFGTGSAVITIPRYQAEAARDRNARLVTVILFLALAALVIAAANVTNILFSRAIRKRRSVGILKALGATRRGVFQLFFLEALLIGIAGAVVGAGLSLLMSKLMQDTMGYGAIYVSLLAAGIIGASALVTALDVFPAMQAARVSAAEAIRYE